MKFKIENCNSKNYIKPETCSNTSEDYIGIIEQAILFIINDEMKMDDKKVIEEIFYQRGLYDILEDAIEEAERLKNNN